MAIAPSAASNTGSQPIGDDGTHIDAPDLRVFVIALFFIFGGITSLNDVIIPKLKELFTLNYTQAMLVQTAFFAAYAIVGIPGAAIVKRVGYMRGAAIGLATMMVGCILFIPASASATFALFLAALFVLASGVTIVQVVSNPLISLLGPAHTAGSRLTFAQAFNSLGTTIFPIAGSILMLGSLAKVKASELSGAALDAYRVAETQAVVHSYLGLALALAIVATVVFVNRNRLKGEHHDHGSVLKSFDLLARPRFGWHLVYLSLCRRRSFHRFADRERPEGALNRPSESFPVIDHHDTAGSCRGCRASGRRSDGDGTDQTRKPPDWCCQRRP